jgi:CHAT domain-containing protein
MRPHSKETNEIKRSGDILESFKGLKFSRPEVKEIVAIYPASSQIWTGKKASEGRLKGLTQVPRVLHFATHAFYLENPMRDVTVARPLTLSGIVLAGANNALLYSELDPDKEDGIFHSLEALGLNLNGTELVVFSACETGQGAIDYSEGVYGLVRAFKIAGAYRILMTLWPVKDEKSKDFMIAFYNNWVNKYPHPTKALRMTQLHYINHPDEQLRVPKIWAAYVLVGP